MEFFFFYIIFFLLSFCCLGHGLLFAKVFNIQNNKSPGVYGLLGLSSLTFISYVSVFFIEDKTYFNVLVLFIGLIFLFKNIKKIYFPKYFWPLILVISCALLISKTHDDFPFYHLQQSLNFSLNKIQVGLSNLDFSYAYHSSILYLNSLFYLPYFKFYFFNAPNLLFLIFFVLFSIDYIFKKNSDIIINFFTLFSLIFVIVKFSRLSEFGTDLSGQLLITTCFIYLLKIIYDKKISIADLKTLIIFVTLSITIKTYFIFYSLLIIFSLYSIGYKNAINFIKSNFLFILFVIIFITIFFILNIFSTGCLIFPLADTCFNQLSWSMPSGEVVDYNIWFQAWAKSLGGAGYTIKNYPDLINNFRWISIWIENYLSKYLETFILLCFLTLVLYLTFKPYKKNSKFSRKQLILVLFLFCVLLFWFYKHPTLRYGGYVIHFVLFSLIFSIFLSRSKLSSKVIYNRAKLLIVISLIIFLVKNFIRINSELSRSDEYKYENFPYFFVKNVNYEKIYLNNDFLFTYVEKDVCWASPPPCGTNKNLTFDRLLDFKVIKRKKNR